MKKKIKCWIISFVLALLFTAMVYAISVIAVGNNLQETNEFNLLNYIIVLVILTLSLRIIFGYFGKKEIEVVSIEKED